MGDTDGGRHVRALRSVALACQEASPATPMPEPILPAVRDLIGYDSAVFVLIDNARQLVEDLAWQEPDGSDHLMSHEDEDALWWEHHTSGCCQPRTPDDVPSVLTEADTMSVRQWHACPLYVELYKPNGEEHLLNLRIPDGPGRTFRLLLWRGPGKGFTERDKTDLFLLKPHFEAAYRRGQRRRAVSALTARQRQLLQLVAQGYTNYQIARRLGVAEGTVRAHLYQIYSRLGVSSRTAAVTQSLIAVED
jgi:DNA-binding CsgD family transcriptional regulator